MKKDLTILAETSAKEDEQVEFKSCFAPQKKAAFWAEIVKDIVAIANTKGGVIVFGLNDDATPSSDNCDALLSFDPAKIVDQIDKYTGLQFSNFEIVKAVRVSGIFPALLVFPTRLPIVFTKVGSYEYAPNQQKTAFSKGTVYFRHGAKSEPANQEDIRDAFLRELETVRQEWLGNVRMVTEAGIGASVVVTQPDEAAANVRLTHDPNAPAIRVRDLSETHPYRQSEAIKEIKKKYQSTLTLNSHDIQAIKHTEGLGPSSHPDLIHKPHSKASPQYSAGFVDFVIQRLAANDNYLKECRQSFKSAKYGP